MSERTVEDLQAGEDQATQPGGAGWDYNPGQADYDKKFRDIASNNPDITASGDRIAAEHRDADASRRGLQDGEKKAVGDTAVGKAAVAASAGINPALGTAIKFLGKIKTRQGATGTAIAGIMVALLVGGGFLAGSLAPIAFFTNVVDDLNDQLSALDIRQDKMTRTKILNVERDASLKGCTTLSVRCKFKSLSSTQVANFKENGIEVKGKTIAGRMFPETYTYRDGQPLKPSEFADVLKTNASARLDFKAAVNMRYLGFKDFVYKKWTQARFKISDAAAKLSGTEEERAKQLASGEASLATQLPKFVEAGVDPETNKPRWVLEGDTGNPPRYYNEVEVQAILDKANALVSADTKPPSEMDPKAKIGVQLLKTLSIVGAADLICSLKNEIGHAAVVAKYARYLQYARYIAPIASLAFKIKAGDASPGDGAAIGRFFTSTDGRAMITDVAGSMQGSGSSSTIPEIDTFAQKPNPYYGKNAMDSSLYKMSVNGGSSQTTESTLKYSLGMGASQIMAAVGATAAVIDTIINFGSSDDTTCRVVQNWFVRGVGFIVGIVSAIGSGGGSIALNLGIIAGIMAGFYAVNAILSSMLKGEVVPKNIDQLPEDRGAIAWTGTSTLTAETARARGLIPGKAKDIVSYKANGTQSMSDYATIDQRSVSPFDTSSPYSTISKIATKINLFKPQDNSLSSYIATARSLVSTSYSRVLSPSSAYAATIDPNRFKQCTDRNYEEMGIDADVQCNVRYIMPQKDLALDTDAVAKYMEDKGFVEPNTTTGLPAGYTPPAAAEASGFVKGLIDGFTGSFYNNRASLYTNKYALFLDYCAYRALPFGKTYDDPGAFGSAGDEWVTGKKCMDQDDPDMSNFRIYTLDKSVADISEPVPEGTPTTAATTSTTPVVTSSSGWVFPIPLDRWKGPFGHNVWGSCTVKCRHAGIDISVPLDTPVLAAHDGKVIVTNSTSSGYGGGYLIEATGTGVYFAYQHMSTALLAPGAIVKAGQEIGKSGCTGNCAGPHLHFSIEKSPRISTYADGAGKSDDRMPSLPPLCFLPMESRLFGPATTNNCAPLGLVPPQ